MWERRRGGNNQIGFLLATNHQSLEEKSCNRRDEASSSNVRLGNLAFPQIKWCANTTYTGNKVWARCTTPALILVQSSNAACKQLSMAVNAISKGAN